MHVTADFDFFMMSYDYETFGFCLGYKTPLQNWESYINFFGRSYFSSKLICK